MSEVEMRVRVERYAGRKADERPVVGTVCIDKYELPRPFPEKIRVTIEPAEWLDFEWR